jgi:hypothetical protein
MNEIIKRFLEESVALELNIGDLYQLFSAKFPEDYHFWWIISIEEMNHAAIIESIDDIFFTESILPPDSIEYQAKELHKMNLYVKEQIEQSKFDLQTRSEAFKIGLELENSVGESHFELFMTANPNSIVMKIFQKLNGDDINHAKRMESYRKENNIY